MYKIFYNYIKVFSLVIGYLNLLRSFYYTSSNNNVEDPSYLIAEEAIVRFKSFCKKTIKEIEKLLESQNVSVTFDLTELVEIKKLVSSISKPASQGMLQEIMDNLGQINNFISFLTSEFPERSLNQVDLRDIKTEINLFKYQIYLS